MVYNQDSFVFPCSCGKPHRILSRAVVIEKGALKNWRAYAENFGLTDFIKPGAAIAVYDRNTYQAVGARRPADTTEIVLEPDHLHADEKSTAELFSRLESCAPHAKLLLAVGAGTVHDITRYCAAKLNVPFISVPTAASVDGFASTVAAMTWYGYKKTMEAAAPVMVLADLDIISQAPIHLTRSGMGDLLGKYICLADWKIAHRLTGEYYCDGIAALTREAVRVAVQNSAGLSAGDPQAYEKLMFGLILSGVAMQLTGNSRPASGAEHHISHAVELGICGPNQALHGEKVGVGTLLCARVYHRFARLSVPEAAGLLSSYQLPDREELQPVFGALTDSVLSENQQDCLERVSAERLTEKWPEIQKILREIPEEQELETLFAGLGLKRSLADIGVDETQREKLLYWSPFVRNRLTFMRILHLMGKDPEMFHD